MKLEDIKINDIIDGTVISIKSYGAIMIFENDVKGLLHISEIANTFIRNITKYLTIGKTYQVKVIGKEEDGFLKVSMSKITQEEKDAFRALTCKNVPVDPSNIDFTPIKDKMGEWINDFKKDK